MSKKPAAKNESVSPINVQSSQKTPVSNPLPVQQKPQQQTKKKGLFDDDDEDGDDFLTKKPIQKTTVQPVLQAKK